jgi:hypothetical protein
MEAEQRRAAKEQMVALRVWLEHYCRTSPGTPSHVVQAALQERFGIQISIGYLNQVRANLGLGSRTPPSGKKTGCGFVPTC